MEFLGIPSQIHSYRFESSKSSFEVKNHVWQGISKTGFLYNIAIINDRVMRRITQDKLIETKWSLFSMLKSFNKSTFQCIYSFFQDLRYSTLVTKDDTMMLRGKVSCLHSAPDYHKACKSEISAILIY